MGSSGTLRWHRICVLSILLASFALAKADFVLMRELALSRYGGEVANSVSGWQGQLEATNPHPDTEKLAWANDYFNGRTTWEQDRVVWNQEDYWATPLEFMALSTGDCEDYAIAKYMSLVLAGVDVEKLKITYVSVVLPGEAGPKKQAHMVLAYYATPGAEPLILDNINEEILPASKRSELTPIYGFNSQQLWVSNSSAPVTQKPTDKLSRWRDLLSRAVAEGLG